MLPLCVICVKYFVICESLEEMSLLILDEWRITCRRGSADSKDDVVKLLSRSINGLNIFKLKGKLFLEYVYFS